MRTEVGCRSSSDACSEALELVGREQRPQRTNVKDAVCGARGRGDVALGHCLDGKLRPEETLVASQLVYHALHIVDIVQQHSCTRHIVMHHSRVESIVVIIGRLMGIKSLCLLEHLEDHHQLLSDGQPCTLLRPVEVLRQGHVTNEIEIYVMRQRELYPLDEESSIGSDIKSAVKTHRLRCERSEREHHTPLTINRHGVTQEILIVGGSNRR